MFPRQEGPLLPSSSCLCPGKAPVTGRGHSGDLLGVGDRRGLRAETPAPSLPARAPDAGWHRGGAAGVRLGRWESGRSKRRRGGTHFSSASSWLPVCSGGPSLQPSTCCAPQGPECSICSQQTCFSLSSPVKRPDCRVLLPHGARGAGSWCLHDASVGLLLSFTGDISTGDKGQSCPSPRAPPISAGSCAGAAESGIPGVPPQRLVCGLLSQQMPGPSGLLHVPSHPPQCTLRPVVSPGSWRMPGFLQAPAGCSLSGPHPTQYHGEPGSLCRRHTLGSPRGGLGSYPHLPITNIQGPHGQVGPGGHRRPQQGQAGAGSWRGWPGVGTVRAGALLRPDSLLRVGTRARGRQGLLGSLSW